MAKTFERSVREAPAGDSGPRELDEERSIRGALRVTLLFLAVVVLLLWAGLADAARPEVLLISSRP
jgi:hypothetical protein